MTGLRVDITDGAYEFHRDDEGAVVIVEHSDSGKEVVIIPAEVWQRNWSRLVSVAEWRLLERTYDVPDASPKLLHDLDSDKAR